MDKILLIEEDFSVRKNISETLIKNGYNPHECYTSKQAIEILNNGEKFSAILIDTNMQDTNVIQTMQEIKKINRNMPIIVLAKMEEINIARDIVQKGAYDFIITPPKTDRLTFTLKRAIEKYNLDRKFQQLNTSVESSLEGVFGVSDAIRKVVDQMNQISWNDISVVIQGETGTGKSFIAQTIHNMSHRAKGPFVKVDIGSIPENLIESELFGHEKGAFTGADRKKIGYFESANKGTIFIDELQNMSLYVQSKILNVVEEKKIYPLGGTKAVSVDVRLITATNIDFKTHVNSGKFRDDLFYRLCEFIIVLPPLRDRKEDIPFLAQKFFTEYKEELKKPLGELHSDTLTYLKNHSWKGNVRELKNVIRRTTLLSNKDIIMPDDIIFLDNNMISSNDLQNSYNSTISDNLDTKKVIPLKELTNKAIQQLEKKAIIHALKITNGNRTKAANLLQISSRSLFAKIKDYGIS